MMKINLVSSVVQGCREIHKEIVSSVLKARILLEKAVLSVPR